MREYTIHVVVVVLLLCSTYYVYIRHIALDLFAYRRRRLLRVPRIKKTYTYGLPRFRHAVAAKATGFTTHGRSGGAHRGEEHVSKR